MKRTYEIIRVRLEEGEKCPCCNWENSVMFKLGKNGDPACPDCMMNYLADEGFTAVKPKLKLNTGPEMADCMEVY